jgi:hypothetical protein
MSLRDLISANATIGEMGALLDAAAPEERWDAVNTLSRKEQRKLYESAAAAQPLDLDYFVPVDRKDLIAVRHRGRNTIPLPGPLKFFAKVFARRQGQIFGYNDSPAGGLIGPGYFVATPTAHEAAWTERGAVVIDYFQVPDGEVPGDWPSVRPNSQGLQMFVYKETRDFMRRVSAHVSIGAAFKRETALDHYFVLVREA